MCSEVIVVFLDLINIVEDYVFYFHSIMGPHIGVCSFTAYQFQLSKRITVRKVDYVLSLKCWVVMVNLENFMFKVGMQIIYLTLNNLSWSASMGSIDLLESLLLFSARGYLIVWI